MFLFICLRVGGVPTFSTFRLYSLFDRPCLSCNLLFDPEFARTPEICLFILNSFGLTQNGGDIFQPYVRVSWETVAFLSDPSLNLTPPPSIHLLNNCAIAASSDPVRTNLTWTPPKSSKYHCKLVPGMLKEIMIQCG